ncbi:MAG: MerC family mercury resistance protein [Planctomycetota bacterium]
MSPHTVSVHEQASITMSADSVPPTTALPVSDTPGVIKHRTWLDRVGITASVACAIHCLAAPFLLLLLPAAGAVWSDPKVHWGLAVLVLPLAVWVIYRGYQKHGKRLTLVAAVTGSGFVIAGLIAPMVSTGPIFTAPAPVLFGAASMATPQDAAPGTTAKITPVVKPVQPETEGVSPELPAVAGADKENGCSDPACVVTHDNPRPAQADSQPIAAEATRGGSPATDAEPQQACAEVCCPTLNYDQYNGTATMGFPAGSVLTIIGSFFLVLAHATNLHACRCLARHKTGDDPSCACPA